MVEALTVIGRCPRHRITLVWDVELQLWVCPKYYDGLCTYAIPGDPPDTLSVQE